VAGEGPHNNREKRCGASGGVMKLKAPAVWIFIISLGLEGLSVATFLGVTPGSRIIGAFWIGALAYAALALGILWKSDGQPAQPSAISIWKTFTIPWNAPKKWVFVSSLLVSAVAIVTYAFNIPLFIMDYVWVLLGTYLFLTVGILTSMGPGWRAATVVCILLVISMTSDNYIISSYPHTTLPDRIIFSTRIVKLISLLAIFVEALRLQLGFSRTAAATPITIGYSVANLCLGGMTLYLLVSSTSDLQHGVNAPREQSDVQLLLDAITDFGPFVPLVIFVILACTRFG
jgi:hypothetical protein